jgi:hypothetical protein
MGFQRWLRQAYGFLSRSYTKLTFGLRTKSLPSNWLMQTAMFRLGLISLSNQSNHYETNNANRPYCRNPRWL